MLFNYIYVFICMTSIYVFIYLMTIVIIYRYNSVIEFHVYIIFNKP